jgi:hypothetical protein
MKRRALRVDDLKSTAFNIAGSGDAVTDVDLAMRLVRVRRAG